MRVQLQQIINLELDALYSFLFFYFIFYFLATIANLLNWFFQQYDWFFIRFTN